MGMQPINMQLTVPRSQEVVQMNNNARPDAQQQMFQQHLVKQTEAENQTVTDAKKSENQTVNKDGKNGNAARQNKKGKNDKSDEKENGKQKQAYRTGLLDIKG